MASGVSSTPANQRQHTNHTTTTTSTVTTTATSTNTTILHVANDKVFFEELLYVLKLQKIKC